jgi:CubicO group peptidase (beta-lactamase class C family)
MRIPVLLLMFGLLAIATPSSQSASIEATVDRELSASGVPAAAVAVIRDGAVTYARGFGRRSLGGPYAGVHTHFEIGSDTKQFTAAAILQLKEAGKLALDDRLVKYVPSFPHAGEITLRQLLNQTSGLPDYVATNHFVHITQTSAGSLERIERMIAGPLHFRPGSRWEFSNSHYVALGRIIEIVSHENYDGFVRAHIFAPAHMRESGFIADEKSYSDVAVGYWRGLHGDMPLTRAPEIGESWTTAAGNIVSTAGDLARWDIALENGRIIDRSDLKLMMTPATLSNGSRDDYGFGWWIDPVRGHTDIYHDGDTFGMSSSNNIFPEYHLEIVVLENEAMDKASHTAQAIFSALLPSLAPIGK